MRDGIPTTVPELQDALATIDADLARLRELEEEARVNRNRVKALVIRRFLRSRERELAPLRAQLAAMAEENV